MYFEIDRYWNDMSSSGGFTGREYNVRIVTDTQVEKEYIVEQMIKLVSETFYQKKGYYIVSICDEDEKFLVSEVEEVIRNKVSRKGLNKRGGNYEMTFSIKFDNQGWWPDET